jgi:bis(5'-nucleosyl)-tetraphosphatase (symmetrical)
MISPKSSTNSYAIGDIQGCFSKFQTLIREIAPSENTQLWLVGDLVNRGPQSLETLRWCVQNQHRIKVVLGNHDLHLLAVAAGVRGARQDDTFEPILQAPDRKILLDWLRTQPLVHQGRNFLMVHAGLLPQWTGIHAIELSEEISLELRSDHWQTFLMTMYGDEPTKWSPQLRGPERARMIINAMTRLRFCTDQGAMEFASKEGIGQTPKGYRPWFEVPNRQSKNIPIVFGHWSTLGLINQDRLLAVDTGCLWGRELTGVSLNVNATDRRLVQV